MGQNNRYKRVAKQNKNNKSNPVASKRKLKAWRLYQDGYTYRQIAEKLKCSKSTIQRDIEAEYELWSAEMRKESSKIKIREYLKLQLLDNKVVEALEEDETEESKSDKAIKEAEVRLKITDRVFKLFGLDKIVIESNENKYNMKDFTDSELYRISQGENPAKILAERNASELANKG